MAAKLSDAALLALCKQVEQVWEPVLGVPRMVRFQIMVGGERAGTISKLRQTDHAYPWKAYDAAGTYLSEFHGEGARSRAAADVLAAYLLQGGSK